MPGFRAGMPPWLKAGDTRRSVTSSFATAAAAAMPPSARRASSSHPSTVAASICRGTSGSGSITSAGAAGGCWRRQPMRFLRAKGLALLRQTEIREVLRRWAMNPEFEADMIVLSPGDQKRVDQWLAERGFNLDHLPETGRPMTRCRRGFVHLRVALHLSGRLPERLASKSVRSAVWRDVKWFAEKDDLEARLPAWDSDPIGAEWQPS